eukprot:12933648-Prorocentrum_lima.AAC.1
MKEQPQRARQEQTNENSKGVDMFVTRVLERKWQEWMASRSPGTPTAKQSAFEASVARALINVERKMSTCVHLAFWPGPRTR